MVVTAASLSDDTVLWLQEILCLCKSIFSYYEDSSVISCSFGGQGGQEM